MMSILDLKFGPRERSFDFGRRRRRRVLGCGVKVINLTGAPGAGKTTLLEAIIDKTADQSEIIVVEGDLYTEIDVKRIAKFDVQTVKINTMGRAYLDPNMLEYTLSHVDMNGIHCVLVDSIENLMQPIGADAAEDIRVGVFSVTDGNEYPRKFTEVLYTSDIIVLNKIDMLQQTDFCVDEFICDIHSVNPRADIILTSATRHVGIHQLCWALMR